MRACSLQLGKAIDMSDLQLNTRANRRMSRFLALPDEHRVTSEVPVDIAASYLSEAISTSGMGGVVDMSELEIMVLAEHMSVVRFAKGDEIIKVGETGSWFGILLSGSLCLEIAPGQPRQELRQGAVIGEMAIWNRSARRSASVRAGSEPGMIASFLVSELEEFMEDLPDVGSKLMRMLGRMALSKQASNLRDELADKVTPALEWKCERRPVSTAELEQLPLDERGLATDDDRAAFVARLDEAGFSTSEAELLSTVAQYHRFEANETLVTAGSRFPFLFFVLQGSVWVTRWGLEVSEGGQVRVSAVGGALGALGSDAADTFPRVPTRVSSRVAALIRALLQP